MSDNPKNDTPIEGLDQDFTVSGATITMHPNGPTSFSVGRNARSFTDSIGGCNMDFKTTASRGYSYKADDVRDLEFKCLVKFNIGGNGFSISCCTGHHTSSGCCQGFAYMGNLEPSTNPTDFRFRKEMWHVSYHDAPSGVWNHSKANFKIDGSGKYIGLGFCRYNKPVSGGTSPQDDHIILEIWFNPDPLANRSNWTMLKREEDFVGHKWGDDGDKCNGAKDQSGPWSGAHNRLKTNATSGTVSFQEITFREIDPFGTFETEPPPPPPITCPTGQHLENGVCVADTTPPPTGCPPGTHLANGVCVADTLPPPTITRVRGFFKLNTDINTVRGSGACTGTGGSGGGGPSGDLVKVLTAANETDKEMSDTSKFDNRKRLTQYVKESGSTLKGVVVKQLDVPLKKVGSPSGTVYARIWSGLNVVYTCPTTFAASSLGSSFADKTFDFATNTYALKQGDRIGVDYKTSSDSNYVMGGYESDDSGSPLRSVMSQYEGSAWEDKDSRNFASTIWA